MLPVRLSIRILWIVLLILVLVPPQLLAKLLFREQAVAIPQLFHRGVCWAFGLKVHCSGEIVNQGSVLFVSNHLAVTDIFVLGGYVRASFVSKADVASWPLLGWMSRLQNTLFIERSVHQIKRQIRHLGELMGKGMGLLFFPEGTAADGVTLLPFKSSLFAVLETAPENTPVQAITLVPRRYQGRAINREQTVRHSWHDDTPLLSYLKRVFVLGRTDIEVIFHPPVYLKDFANRKQLAAHTQVLIDQGLQQGRDLDWYQASAA